MYDKNTLDRLYSTIVDKRNISNKKEWGKELSDFLIENKDAYFITAQPGGNNGDFLIYKGLYKKLRDLNIKYEEKYEEKGVRYGKTKMVLIHGGGNMNDLWGNGTSLLKNMISRHKFPIIVAPQSYYFTQTNFSDILKKANQKIYLFCRERYSYSILSKMQLPNNVGIYISDDTAFYMNKEDFSSIDSHEIGKEYVLLCFRTDKESNLGDLGNMRSKITDIFREILKGHNVEIIEADISINTSFSDFVGYTKGAKIVVTDRLHVGILASILEKPTILFSNSYFKSKSVYEYSLKYFPYTVFVDS